MNLRIKNCSIQEIAYNIDIKKGIIHSINPITPGKKSNNSVDHADEPPEKIIDAKGMIAIPSFKNGHTHAAMTLLRGYGEDMNLKQWLETRIWPTEAKLTGDDIYWGTRLACLEMIKSGTTFCNDMYFFFPDSYKAFNEAGIKAAGGPAFFDFFDTKKMEEAKALSKECYSMVDKENPLFQFTISPHSIYTVSPEALCWVADFAGSHNLPVHIHLSETSFEVQECLKNNKKRPVEHLQDTGLLDISLIAAHGIWLDEKEINMLVGKNITIVHNPCSNMKLSSGAFPYSSYLKNSIPLMLGTDGAASNNSLSMFQEMKHAALLQKHHYQNPELLGAEEVFSITTGNNSSLFSHISGLLGPGEPADILLINPKLPELTPRHNFISNLVYAANQECVDTVICNGKVLMQNRIIPEEQEILNEACRKAEELVKRK